MYFKIATLVNRQRKSNVCTTIHKSLYLTISTRKLSLLDNPIANRALGAIIIDAYLEEALAVG